MAQAALQQTSFDPAQAANQLNAGRQAARIERQKRTIGAARPRGQVLRFPNERVRPTTNAASGAGGEVVPLRTAQPINEEAIYGSGASAQQRTQAEQINKTQWQQDRQHQLQQSRNTALPAQVAQTFEAAPEIAQDAEVQHMVGDYQGKMRDLAQREQGTAPGDPVRRALDRRKQQVKDELWKKIKQSKIFQEGKKKVTGWIWRGVGPIGSTGDAIDLGAIDVGLELIGGACISLFQSTKTVILPHLTEPKPGDPDAGKIMKGVLAWLEPDSLDPKDPFTWGVDAPYSAIAWFILHYIHALVLALLTVIGAVILVFILGAEMFGELGTMIGSWLGL